MNHNKFQAKMFDPNTRTEKAFNHTGFCWALSGLMLAFVIAGSVMGWFDAAEAQLVLTELPSTGK